MSFVVKNGSKMHAGLVSHPGAVVGYLEHYRPRPSLRVAIVNRAASRHCVTGVDREVEEHLPDLTRIGCHGPR